MQDSTLLRISLILSILGVIALYVISSMISESIEDDNEQNIITADIASTISLTGTVKKVRTSPNAAFIEIETIQRIPVVIFENSTSVKEGDRIKVLGTVEEYEGKKELLADVIQISDRQER